MDIDGIVINGPILLRNRYEGFAAYNAGGIAYFKRERFSGSRACWVAVYICICWDGNYDAKPDFLPGFTENIMFRRVNER